ncbi:recombinase family protein [Niallia sp. 03133]|uniref:recombinase family protein n=1 Tax=Niallia sp. 03133 TaxID=3458060 RepID=UPI004044A62E
MKTKVALYVRVSTEDQAENGYSIEAQLNTLRNHCEMLGKTIVEEYIDKGISGKSINGRNGLKRLLEDAKKGKFNEVIVWKISRLARNTIDLLKIVEELHKNNVIFRSYSENFETETPMGKFALQMMGAVAELERNTIVDNVKLGMTQRAKEGKWNGGSMLGYASKDKELIIIEEEANLVRYIFDLYISGKGYKAIANTLNHEGYKTKRNKAFSINSVRTIITNPCYAGFIRFNQVENWNEKRRKGTNKTPVIVKGEHKPIISEDIWEKTKSILIQKSHKPAKTFTGTFPLTTLLRCQYCGQGMIGHKSKKNKNGNEYIRYYQCGNFHYKGSSVCKSHLVNADIAEEYVFKKIEELTSKPSVLKEIVGRVNKEIKSHKEPIQNNLNYINKSIRDNEKSIQKLMTIIETKDSFPKVILKRLEELEIKQNELLEQKKYLEFELNKPTIKEISFEQVSNVLSAFSKILPTLPPEQQKDFLHSIINKITVNKGNSPSKRNIKDIELFFDVSSSTNYVLTYDTVPPD